MTKVVKHTLINLNFVINVSIQDAWNSFQLIYQPTFEVSILQSWWTSSMMSDSGLCCRDSKSVNRMSSCSWAYCLWENTMNAVKNLQHFLSEKLNITHVTYKIEWVYEYNLWRYTAARTPSSRRHVIIWRQMWRHATRRGKRWCRNLLRNCWRATLYRSWWCWRFSFWVFLGGWDLF